MSNVISRRKLLIAMTGMSGLWLVSETNLLAAQSQTQEPVAPTTVDSLTPGKFLWTPTIAPTGPVLAIISLASQRCYVYRNGVQIGVSTISSGKPGHQTPTGIFTVLQKQLHHKSNLYDSAPMPYMQRLTWSGVAMHAGNLPGYAASHGCVRLPMDFARLLYAATKLGMTVVITDSQGVPRIAPTPDLLQSENAIELAETGDALWQPEKALTGPLSLILSANDKRLVVLRNGTLIGSCPVSIQGIVAETTAYSLSRIDAEGFHWFQLPLPGQNWTGDRELSSSERARVGLPAAFRSQLDAVLTPGVTLVVTTDSLKESGTGKAVTVIVSAPGFSGERHP